MRAQPADARQHEAYLEVTNASVGAKEVQVRIAGVGAPAVSRQLELAGGASASVVVDVSAFGEGPLRASVRADGDALPLDDVAYAYLPGKGRVRVGLVTAGNADLARTLRLLPRLAVEVIPPGALRDARRFDALILDRFVPSEPPPVPALLIGPRSVPWLARGNGGATDTRLARWDGSHPLLSGVSLRDVLVDRATLLKPGTGERAASLATVAQGPGGEPLILAAREGRRLALVGFALEDVELPAAGELSGLPVQRDRLADARAACPRRAGRAGERAGCARPRAGSGRARGRHARGARRDAVRRGRARAVHRARAVTSACGWPSTCSIRTSPRSTPVASRRALPRSLPSQGAPPLTTDPWILLLVLAALLLAAEWWTYQPADHGVRREGRREAPKPGSRLEARGARTTPRLDSYARCNYYDPIAQSMGGTCRTKRFSSLVSWSLAPRASRLAPRSRA